MNQSKWTLGRTSLILLGSFVMLLVLTALLTYFPRDNDFRAVLTWLGLLIGFSFVILAVPLLGSSLVVGIMSIVKDRGRMEGIVAISGNVLLLIGGMAWLILT